MEIKVNDRSVINLLHSAVLSLRAAEKSGSVELTSVLVKHAILHSAFFIECLANCVLAHLMGGKKLLEKLDRFPLLDKLDFCRVQLTGQSINRGIRPYQLCGEIFALRDGYVHPKTRRSTVKVKVKAPGSKELDYEQKSTQILRIPLRPDNWTVNHGKLAVKAAVEVANHFTVTDSGLSLAQAEAIFLSTLEQGQETLFLRLQNFAESKEYLRTVLKVEVHFIP